MAAGDGNLPPVGIVGGGTFGRGLALATARKDRRALLVSRTERELGPKSIRSTTQFAELTSAELIFVAVPSAHMADVAARLGPHLDGTHLLVHVSRGLVGKELRTMTQLLRAETPCRRVGALAGPLVADALAEGKPGGAVVGTRFPEVGEAVREAIGSAELRVYESADVLGVEVASAMVGLLTLAAGYVKGAGLGPAALAVLVTRGMTEASRVSQALGANPQTVSGLAGFGDLIAAIAGDERPEMLLGRALAEGVTLEQASEVVGANIESIAIAGRAADYAARIGLATPILHTLADFLAGSVTRQEAAERLMSQKVEKE